MSELMPWHKTILTDIDYNRVDLVKEGANSKAHIKLFKSKGESPMDLQALLAKMKPEDAAGLKVILKAKDDEIAASEKAKKDAEDALEELKKAAPQPSLEGQSEEEIIKSVKDPAVRAILETQIAKTKAAEAVAKKLKDEQDQHEAIAKAKEVPGIGAEEAKLAEVYKKLKTVDQSLCDDVFGIFKAASALVNEGGAMTEIGISAGTGAVTEGDDENAIWSQIEAKGDAIAKSKNISKEKALAEAIQQNPELYNQYLKAQLG